MTVYVLGIGSNENAEHQCRKMVLSIRQKFGHVFVSDLITTKAVGIDAPDYMNGVVCFESDIHGEELLLWCKALEKELGRDRSQQLCAADIDFLLAYERDSYQPLEMLIQQIDEPWFKPLAMQVVKLL